MLVSEKESSDINFERLKIALINLKNNLVDSENNMFLTVDSLVDIKNITTCSNDIFLRKVNVKPCEYDKMCMDKDLIDNKLYQLTDHFDERKINHWDFYLELLDNIHPFYYGNGRTYKILFKANFS